MNMTKRLGMRSVIRVIAVVLLIAVLAGCFPGCEKNDVSSAIEGTWDFDSYTTGYTFTFYKQGNKCIRESIYYGGVISRYYGTYKIDVAKNQIIVKYKNEYYNSQLPKDDLNKPYIETIINYSYESESGSIILKYDTWPEGILEGVKR